MATLTANATANLSADGKNTTTGSMTWTVPSMPNGVTSWDSIVITGSWSWGGKGNIHELTIDGQNVAADAPFSVTTTKNPPITLTCVGGNKNTSGPVDFADLVVTYTYYVYYKINLQQSTGGTFTVSATQAESGDTIRITPTPNAGYELAEVFVNGVSNGTSTTFSMPAKDTTVTVVWSKINYTLSKGTCTGCSIALSANTATVGDQVAVTVTLDTGYENAVVYVNGSSISGNTFSMPAQNTTVHAVAQKKRYTISITQPQNGTIEVSDSNPQHGDTITLTNNPDIGYELKTYIVNGSAISGNSFVVTGNTTASAEFAQTLFSITEGESVGCTFTISKTSANYGELISVTPTLNTGYENPVLYMDGVAQTGLSFSMPAKNVTVDVRASKKTYTITVTQSTGGTISVSDTSPQHGDVVTISGTPATGYELDSYYINGAVNGATFTAIGNTTVSVVWKKINYTLTKGETVGCSFTLSKATANYQDEISVNIVLDTGYEKPVVYVNNVAQTGTSFAMPPGNVTVDVRASKKVYNVSVIKATGGSVQVSDSTPEHGDTVTLTNTPDIGYVLDYYTLDGVKLSENTFTATKNCEVSAVWKEIDYTITIGTCTCCSIKLSVKTAHYQDNVIVTVTLDTGYENPIIYVNGTAISGNTFLMPSKNTTVYAVASKIEYAISVQQSDGGTVSVDKNTAFYGDVVTITATPDPWYEIGAYYVNGVVITGNTFTVKDNSIVTVRFFASENTERLYFKQNGIWTPVMQTYRKENGVWVIQEHPSLIFDENTTYIKGN